MPYMVTFTINIPPMLAYIPYMDPMGIYIYNVLICARIFACYHPVHGWKRWTNHTHSLHGITMIAKETVLLTPCDLSPSPSPRTPCDVATYFLSFFCVLYMLYRYTHQ